MAQARLARRLLSAGAGAGVCSLACSALCDAEWQTGAALRPTKAGAKHAVDCRCKQCHAVVARKHQLHQVTSTHLLTRRLNTLDRGEAWVVLTDKELDAMWEVKTRVPKEFLRVVK